MNNFSLYSMSEGLCSAPLESFPAAKISRANWLLACEVNPSDMSILRSSDSKFKYYIPYNLNKNG